MESPASAMTIGPLRPIPIHLPRPPVINNLNYRVPALPAQLDTPPKKPTPLWNPALDLRSPVSKKVDAEPTVITPAVRASDPPPSSKTSPPTPPASSSENPVSSPSPTSGFIPPKSSSTILFDQLKQGQVKSVEQPLLSPPQEATSKELLFLPPTKVGHHTKLPLPHLPNPLTLTPHHLPHGVSLVDPQLSLQNALALAAQSRAAMLNHVVSSQFPFPGLSPNHRHSHAQQRLHQSQHLHRQRQQLQQQQQQHQQSQPHAQPILHQKLPTNFFRPHQAHPEVERSVSLHNALALAQSRVLFDGVSSSHQVLSPLVSMDTSPSHGYGRKLFPCPQCRYTTDRRNNLKRHMLTMHQTSSKLLECCGIFFNTKASLREHAMIFHYHGYTCYFCGRRFCRKALLKRHLSVHNGQKDFVCTVCDYATSHKSNLERHRKVHSRQEDGKDDLDCEEGRHYHDDVKSYSSEAVSHDDVSSDELSVCSDYDDDIDVEINVHSD